MSADRRNELELYQKVSQGELSLSPLIHITPSSFFPHSVSSIIILTSDENHYFNAYMMMIQSGLVWASSLPSFPHERRRIVKRQLALRACTQHSPRILALQMQREGGTAFSQVKVPNIRYDRRRRERGTEGGQSEVDPKRETNDRAIDCLLSPSEAKVPPLLSLLQLSAHPVSVCPIWPMGELMTRTRSKDTLSEMWLELCAKSRIQCCIIHVDENRKAPAYIYWFWSLYKARKKNKTRSITDCLDGDVTRRGGGAHKSLSGHLFMGSYSAS